MNHMQNDLAQKVLERIEEERLAPRPRWQFFIKNQLFWLLLGVSVFLSAAAAGAMLFAFANAGWEFRDVTHDGVTAYFLETIPFVWIVVLVGILFLAYENIRHTKTGYRYPASAVLAFILLGTVVGGMALYVTGVGGRVEEEIGLHLPLHRPMLMKQRVFWTNPSRGLLAGRVISFEPDFRLFRLRTFDGKEWTINGEALSSRSRDTVSRERLVRVVGIPVDPASADGATFRSCFVLQWETIGFMHRPAPDPFAVPLPPPSDGERDERNPFEPRSTECKGVRPYRTIKALQYSENPY